MYPSIEISLKKIKENASLLLKLCHTSGIEPCAVTKAVCGNLQISAALLEAGFKELADSRLENLSSLRNHFDQNIKLLLLRLPMLSQHHLVPALCDSSLNSELSVLQQMENHAKQKGLKHNIILMVELGDLREGFCPHQLDEVQQTVSQFSALHVEGLGVNLSCYGGIVPDVYNLTRLGELKNNWERNSDQLKILSGGNSSSIKLLLENKMPEEINHLRLGESILLGRETINRKPIPGAHLDAFKIRAEVIELKEKPSIPFGTVGQDAFGDIPEFIDRGIHRRAILAIGRQDINLALEPLDPGLEVLGASSDHLIIDASANSGLKVGDVVDFVPGYAALLAAMTSPYVEKVLSD